MSIVDSLRSLKHPTTEEEVRLISEVALNILYGTVPLLDDELKYFKANKKSLRLLISKYSWKRKQKIISPELLQNLVKSALRHLDG